MKVERLTSNITQRISSLQVGDCFQHLDQADDIYMLLGSLPTSDNASDYLCAVLSGPSAGDATEADDDLEVIPLKFKLVEIS